MNDAIVRADIEVSQYGFRQVWEELLQATGPLGDYGPSLESVMDRHVGAEGVTRPSSFDAWTIRTGYRLKPGASRAELEAALRAT